MASNHSTPTFKGLRSSRIGQTYTTPKTDNTDCITKTTTTTTITTTGSGISERVYSFSLSPARQLSVDLRDPSH
eukprot:3939364-Rhodomonas_salina.1